MPAARSARPIAAYHGYLGQRAQAQRPYGRHGRLLPRAGVSTDDEIAERLTAAGAKFDAARPTSR